MAARSFLNLRPPGALHFKTQTRSLLLGSIVTASHIAHTLQRSYASLETLDRKPFEHAAGTVPPSTRGSIRFHAGTTDDQPAFLDTTPGRQHETNIKPSEEKIVNITDIRNYDPPATLAVEGCEWVHSPTTLKEEDLLDEDKTKGKSAVEGAYFEEVAKLVRERTGASKTLPYNWRYRRLEKDFVPGATAKGYLTKPLATFHMDNDRQTAEMNLRKYLGDTEAERWLGKRWGIINVWRPIGESVLQWPLAVLDSHEIKAGEATEPIFTRNNYKSHINALKYNPDFKFYYVDKLTTDEALLFVDFDSRKSWQLTGLAHGAFQDHSTPINAPLRRSIEVRVLTLWDDEA